MTPPMKLNEKIQKLRKDHGISQEQLAERLNVTRQAISKWETGEGMPDIENILQLSAVFNVSVDYLLKNQITHPSPAPVLPEPENENLALADTLDKAPGTGFNSRIRLFLSGGEGLSGVIFPIAILVYLILGLYFDMWRTGWAVFFFAWVLTEVVSFLKTRRLKMSIYGIATVIFIAVGLITGAWEWVIFVAAWVISSVSRSVKRKNKNRGA